MDFDKVSIKNAPWRVGALAQLKHEHNVHLPDLQRGFVWTPERVRALFDSLYRRYPVGALLLWKPTWETDDAPFITRPWDIMVPNPHTKKGEPEPTYKVNPGALFVLDGQQRLTSLFRVIFQSRLQGRESLDPDLLVSLSPQPEWADNPFHLKSKQIRSQEKDGLLVRAEVLFAGIRGENESQAIRAAIKQWVRPDDDLFYAALDRANAIRNSVLNAEILAYEIDASAQSDSVIEIFVRLNQQGVRLRPSDLAAARLTGKMRDFREQAKQALAMPCFSHFARDPSDEELRRAPLDTDLLVRTALFLGTGVVRYRDVEKRKNGDGDNAYLKVEAQWPRAVSGLESAVERLRRCGVPEGSWLPYRYLLLAPAIAHANGHHFSDDFWLGWSIAASLWGHYAGSAETTAQNDAKLARDGNQQGLLASLKDRARRTSLIPDVEDFTENIVQESGVFLSLLALFARRDGRSFPGGKLFSSGAESIEVHHLFPRKLLSRTLQDSSTTPDRLGNLSLIFASDNGHISDDPPVKYFPTCAAEDLALQGVPLDRGLWDTSAYAEFCTAREENLAVLVRELLEQLGLD